MRFALLSLAVCFLVSPAEAISCFDIDENRKLSCDYCFVTHHKRSSSPHFHCLNGSLYASLRNSCWSDEEEASCVCDTDNCAETVALPKMQQGHLECWPKGENVDQDSKKKSLSCMAVQIEEGPSRWSDENPAMTSLASIIRPQSCVSLQGNNERKKTTVCTCDTSDSCATELMKEQRLFSEKVTCHMDNYAVNTTTARESCTGDFCFIEKNEKSKSGNSQNGYIIGRGCITNNETLYPGLFKAGSLTTVYAGPSEYLVCETSRCNVDWETAYSSVQGQTKTTLTLSTTASSAVQSALFEIEYRKLFYSIKTAVDSFISRFAELYG